MLTKWELGQDLILISDFISEIQNGLLENGHKELVRELDCINALVGDLFIENNDHSFGIFDSNDLPDKCNSFGEEVW